MPNVYVIGNETYVLYESHSVQGLNTYVSHILNYRNISFFVLYNSNSITVMVA